MRIFIVLFLLLFPFSAIAQDKNNKLSTSQAKTSLIRKLKTDSYSESAGMKRHIEDASFDGCNFEFTSYLTSSALKKALQYTIPLNHIDTQKLKIDDSDGETVKIALATKNSEKKIVVKGEIKIGEQVSPIDNFIPQTDMTFQTKKTADEILKLLLQVVNSCK